MSIAVTIIVGLVGLLGGFTLGYYTYNQSNTFNGNSVVINGNQTTYFSTRTVTSVSTNHAVSTVTSTTTYVNTQQITSYQSLLNLQNSQREYGPSTINSIYGDQVFIKTFQSQYTGYVQIQGTSNSTNLYARVVDSSALYPLDNYHYVIGKAFNVSAPILSGQISVYVQTPCGNLGCNFGSTNYNATLTVTLFN